MSPLLKYWFNIESFYDASRPCVLLQKFCGLLPFTVYRIPAITRVPRHGASVNNNPVSGAGSLKSEVKFMDVVIFALWQAFFLQMLFAQWPSMMLNSPMSRIIGLVSLVLQLIGGFSCSSSSLLALLCRKKFVKMVHLVESADCLFQKWFGEIPHTQLHFGSVALLLATCIANVSLIVFDSIVESSLIQLEKPSPVKFMYLYFYIIRTVQIIAVTTFIAGLYNFRTRLQAFSRQFRVMFLEQQASGPRWSCPEMQERIQGLVEIYTLLCDSIRMFCMLFAWQPMFFCATLITAAVFAILTLSNKLSNEAPILTVLSIIYTLPTVLFALHFLLIIKLGSDLKNEGKQIAVLAHKAINQSSKTPAIVERLMLFSRHLQHQRPVVSCGLFCFDWTLALSLISALATYSVILIQFELVVPKFFISAIVQYYEENHGP
ncbi:uncharacterized protein LOC131211440 [Anopheles bellator]|uniref:uncharacterized protein LOC131211440 n=1 Tax=Anopheles bellator TaxID=139047 RepID=UPI002649A3F7|nr:uncharacterized protein LOC131211440 [Anopheles bellator]